MGLNIKRLFRELEEAGYPPPSVKVLSEYSGIPYTATSRLLSGHIDNPSLNTIRKLIKGLYEYYNPLMPSRSFEERMNSILVLLVGV